MATPMLRALSQHFGDRAQLVGIMKPYVGEVLEGTTWLNEIIHFDRKSPLAQQRCWAVAKRLRASRFDSMMLLTNSLRAASMAWFSAAPQRIGYVRYGRGSLLTERLYPPRVGRRLAPVSAVDYYLQLAYAIGAEVNSRQLELETVADNDCHARQIWSSLGFGPQRPVTILNTGAAYGLAKQWPTEYFAELASRISIEMNSDVLVICGPDERSVAAEIQRQAASPNVHSLSNEKLSIGLSKAIIRRGQLLISTDSGPRHFGAAFGVPTITLFGPTDPRWSENYHDDAVHLQRKVPCGPCGKRQCPFEHHRCMRELTVEHAFRAAARLLRHQLERQVA